MSAAETIISDARVAAEELGSEINTDLIAAFVSSRDGKRKQTHAAFERAIVHARELVTRLEVAQQLYAATPLERQPVDSAQWTGRP